MNGRPPLRPLRPLRTIVLKGAIFEDWGGSSRVRLTRDGACVVAAPQDDPAYLATAARLGWGAGAGVGAAGAGGGGPGGDAPARAGAVEEGGTAVTLDFIDRPVDQIRPLPYTRPPAPRQILGIVIHHTATSADPAAVRQGGSWHWLVGRAGTLYRDVAEADIAHHVGATDRWRPPWVVRSPYAVSDINYCSIGIEITYAPQNGEAPNDAQYAALRALLADIYARYGELPVVGHGEVDLSRWPTEPHALDWTRAGFGPRTAAGRYLLPAEEDDVSLRDELNAVTAERDQLNGVNAELGRQLAEKDRLLQEANSAAGAWQEEAGKRQRRLDALAAQVDTLQQQVGQLSRALDNAGHRAVREATVVYTDGQAARLVPAPVNGG